MNASELFDIDELHYLVSQGYISSEVNTSGKLTIYHSTRKADQEWPTSEWPSAAVVCQGLILDDEYNIIARPPSKIFEWMAYEGDIPTDFAYQVLEYIPGIPCVMYVNHAGVVQISATDSFASPASVFANDLYYQGMPDRGHLNEILDTHTPVFRLMAPAFDGVDQDYPIKRGLVLVEIVNKMTGRRMQIHDEKGAARSLGYAELWSGFRVHEASHGQGLEAIYDIDQQSRGYGFYTYFNNGMRLRMHFEELAGMERVKPGVISSSVIWNHLRDDNMVALDNLLDTIPNEFADWALDLRDDMARKFMALKLDLTDEYFEILQSIDPSLLLDENQVDRVFAYEANKSANKALLFCKKNNQNMDNLIWGQIKPKHIQPYKESQIMPSLDHVMQI